MDLKIFLGAFFSIFVVILLFIYWFVPMSTIEFVTNFNSEENVLSNSRVENVQFYENMRFADSNISYRIYDCPLKKKNDMEQAFDIVSNLTVLSFFEVGFDEDILITCDSKNRIEEGLFIAGEGGPTNITKGEAFNVILRGEILLIRNSKCANPNVALHELFHVLGFDHSNDSKDIMYSFSKCRQTISQSTIELLNELYSTSSLADLAFGDVRAVMNGRYLDVNMSIRNDGLKDVEGFNILIFADDVLVKEFGLDGLAIGHSNLITLANLWVNQINVKELEFVIDFPFPELEKNNNRIKLEIKNEN